MVLEWNGVLIGRLYGDFDECLDYFEDGVVLDWSVGCGVGGYEVCSDGVEDCEFEGNGKDCDVGCYYVFVEVIVEGVEEDLVVGEKEYGL